MVSCDLWEEIRSADLFWNIYTRRKALRLGAIFAGKMGDTTRQNNYNAAVKRLENQLDTHYKNGYLFEDLTRLIDGSVVHAINVGFNESKDDTYLSPVDVKVASTVAAYNSAFCKE